MLLRDLVCTIPNSQYMKTNDAPFFVGDADELKKGEHWVTVSKEGGNPRRILLNGKGEIVGGDVPKEQQGKKIDKAAKEKGDGSSISVSKENAEIEQTKTQKTRGHHLAEEVLGKSLKETQEKQCKIIQKELNIDKNQANFYKECLDKYVSPWGFSGGKGIDKELNSSLEEYIEKAPKWGDNGKIYRGLAFLDIDKYNNFLKEGKIGSKIDMKGVNSWTSDKGVAEGFSGKGDNELKGIILQLNKSNYATSINYLAGSPQAKELIISSKPKLKVIDIKKISKNKTILIVEEEG